MTTQTDELRAIDQQDRAFEHVNFGTANKSPTGTRPTLWFLCGRMAPNEPIRYLPIHCSPFIIGRQSQAGLSLASRTVSSLHAEITDTGTSLVLRDLGSTNGTYVNGRRVVGSVELHEDDLIQFAKVAFRVLQQTSSSADTGTLCEDVMDRAMALVQFDRLMSEEAVIPHYQPIVDLSGEQVVGFEVLARSRIAGMDTPAVMFSAAAQLSLETQLSQMVRCKAILETRSAPSPPHLFVNTHPAELERPGLIGALRAMRELSRSQPLTLEIHEKAIADRDSMKKLRAVLRDLDIGLAFDDFGVGEARISQLSEVQPDYLKFDISLVHRVDTASRKHQQMIGSLVSMARDLGVVTLAEGVETKQERDVCIQLGFELAQGFFLGRPVALRHSSASNGSGQQPNCDEAAISRPC